jgi:2-polyprenyl-3-methyl-5-hydroxy-6-metoxy-1,4-benzoquinol methylase
MSTKFSAKIIDNDDSESNEKNQSWWQNNPMTYDWGHDLGEIKYNKDYFDAVDEIFGYGHSLCNNPRWPDGYILENFIPYNDLQGKSVLEIGCGAGLVSSHLAKAGAELIAVDLTDQAIEITKARFDLKNLSADIKQMDAEKMEFEHDTFDFVISWGVIHHSGNMQNILDEIYRVLKPCGKAYLMVYNKTSLRSIVFAPFWLGVVRAKLLTKNVKEIISEITDGYIARHLSEVEFNKMAKIYKRIEYSYSDEMDSISSYALGPFRRILLPFPMLKEKVELFLATRWGWYMQIILEK